MRGPTRAGVVTTMQPTPRHNSGHYDRHSAARGRGIGGGGGGHFQPQFFSGNYRGRGSDGDGVRGGGLEGEGKEILK